MSPGPGGLAEGKVALVTGGGSGIGRATASLFASEGARGVVVADVDGAAAGETARLLRDAGHDAHAVEVDVARPVDVAAMVDATLVRYGALDLAFNNAGIGSSALPLVDGDEDDFDRVVAVNLKGVFLCMQAELRVMLAAGPGAGGSIVNTASTSGLVGTPRSSAYVAAKHGVVGLTKTAALEYGRDGIRVNAVCPGPIETPLLGRSLGDSPRRREAVLAHVPLGRFGVPGDVAAAVVWLCSDRAGYVTGEVMQVDGGLVEGQGALHPDP